MKLEEAKKEIRKIWNQLSMKEKNSNMVGLKLQAWLTENRPDLLTFRCKVILISE